jgi:hypothetical protein
MRLFGWAIVCTIVTAAPASAAMIYSSGDPLANAGTHYAKSDTVAPSSYVAGTFELSTAAKIDSVSWWGAWNFFVPAVDNFTINFYGDVAGRPDPTNLIASRNVGNVVETSTGQVRSGFTLYAFQASIVPVRLFAATDYWISIYDSAGTNGSQYFLWRIIGNTAPRGQTNNPAGTWSVSPNAAPLAFQLQGTPLPEPGTLTLASLGAIASIARAGRRRAAIER